MVAFDMIKPSRISGCFWLVVLCAAIGSTACLAETKCDFCGMTVWDVIYKVNDEIALTTKHACKTCSDKPPCYLCSLPVLTNSPGSVVMNDGRVICPREAATAVLDPGAGLKAAQDVREWMNRAFGRFLEMPDTNCTIELVDRPTLQTRFKFAGRDHACPDVWGTTEPLTNKGVVTYQVSLLSGLPTPMLRHVAAHELTHAWLMENIAGARLDQIDQASIEGFCEFFAWVLDESCPDKDLKAHLRRNSTGYSRGQVELFLQANQRFGLNDILDWLMYGTTVRLVATDLAKIREVEMPAARKAPTAKPAFQPAPVRPDKAYSAITLQAVFWNGKASTAMINGKSFAVNEAAAIKLYGTNINVRCLGIEPTRVRVSLEGAEQELRLR